MNEDDKRLYVEKADQDKIRYEKEMAHYKPPKGEKGSDKKITKRRKKDPNAPKRNL